MRISNLQFPKGAVVFADPNEGDCAYLRNRPLIVVSNPIHIYDSIYVCMTGSRHKPGIAISLYDYQNGKYVSGYDKTTIYPNVIHTIKTSQIRHCIGILDPFIMKEVDEAVQFFMGFSTKPPKYLENQDHLWNVEYDTPEKYASTITSSEMVSEKYCRSMFNQSTTDTSRVDTTTHQTPKTEIFPTPAPVVSMPSSPALISLPSVNEKANDNGIIKRGKAPSIENFIHECTIPNSIAITSHSEMYEAYVNWCKTWTNGTVYSANGFGMAFTKWIKKYMPDVTIQKENRRNVYRGIRLELKSQIHDSLKGMGWYIRKSSIVFTEDDGIYRRLIHLFPKTCDEIASLKYKDHQLVRAFNIQKFKAKLLINKMVEMYKEVVNDG